MFRRVKAWLNLDSHILSFSTPSLSSVYKSSHCMSLGSLLMLLFFFVLCNSCSLFFLWGETIWYKRLEQVLPSNWAKMAASKKKKKGSSRSQTSDLHNPKPLIMQHNKMIKGPAVISPPDEYLPLLTPRLKEQPLPPAKH